MLNKYLGGYMFKIFLLIIAVSFTVIGFQNCSKVGFQQAAQSQLNMQSKDSPPSSVVALRRQPAAVPATVTVRTQVESSDQPVTARPNIPAQQSCFSKGFVFMAGSPQALYIYYRKCDGEIESWRAMGQSQCCSGKVSIVDVATIDEHISEQEYLDNPNLSRCPRYQGQMTCL